MSTVIGTMDSRNADCDALSFRPHLVDEPIPVNTVLISLSHKDCIRPCIRLRLTLNTFKS